MAGQKETEPQRIEQTGDQSMVVEHDDGSKFVCSFDGDFPSKSAMAKVKRSKSFSKGDGTGTGKIKEFRDKMGLNDKFYTDPNHPLYDPDYVPVDERENEDGK